MVKISYIRNFWEKKRERSREKREEWEKREKVRDRGWKPRFYFSCWPRHAGAQRVMLERGRVPNLSFRYSKSTQERTGLRSSVPPRLSMEGCARAWLPGSTILVFLPFLISNAPQVMVLYTYLHLLKLMSPLILLSINFKI